MKRTRPTKLYYSVAVGAEVGIFQSWAHVKEATNGYPGNVQKGFESFEEAVVFLKNSNANQSEDTITVTDKNGKKYSCYEYCNSNNSTSSEVNENNNHNTGMPSISTTDCDHSSQSQFPTVRNTLPKSVGKNFEPVQNTSVDTEDKILEQKSRLTRI